MEMFNSLSHSRYDCKYHVVFVPKFRKKSLFGKIKQYLKGVFHELARQKGSEIVSGHMALDNVHMCISIPPKYAVPEVIGYLKGKSGAPRGASVAGSESHPKENSASCILDRVLGLQR